MKKILSGAVALALAAVSWYMLSGFSKNTSNEDALRKRIAELEMQLAEVTQSAPCNFNYFESTTTLASFIEKNYDNPKYSFNTVAVAADSLRSLVNSFTADYKGRVFISIVHTTLGKEIDISGPGKPICNPSVCCPPKCRKESFGLLSVPKSVSNP